MESELDGMPMSGGEGEGEDLDGVPLDGAALLKGAMKHSRPLPPPDDDLDGVPSKSYKLGMYFAETMQWLRRLGTVLSLWRLGSVPVGFVVEEVALGWVFPRVLWYSLSISFHHCSPHTHTYITWGMNSGHSAEA
jgi:hypothetical protein